MGKFLHRLTWQLFTQGGRAVRHAPTAGCVLKSINPALAWKGSKGRHDSNFDGRVISNGLEKGTLFRFGLNSINGRMGEVWGWLFMGGGVGGWQNGVRGVAVVSLGWPTVVSTKGSPTHTPKCTTITRYEPLQSSTSITVPSPVSTPSCLLWGLNNATALHQNTHTSPCTLPSCSDTRERSKWKKIVSPHLVGVGRHHEKAVCPSPQRACVARRNSLYFSLLFLRSKIPQNRMECNSYHYLDPPLFPYSYSSKDRHLAFIVANWRETWKSLWKKMKGRHQINSWLALPQKKTWVTYGGPFLFLYLECWKFIANSYL